MELDFKRCFDVGISCVALVLLFPLFVIVCFLIAIIDGRPVFFNQRRPGRHGVPFRMVKFRTMSNSRSPDGQLLTDKMRLTSLGQVLRSTSLDELPELWNVLKGDMSLVGPRPLLMEYLPLYSSEQARRHEVRPGITGWAQAKGRNSLSWEERFALDVWYVDNASFQLDLYILWLTIRKVLKREGISHKGEATMSRFTGSPK